MDCMRGLLIVDWTTTRRGGYLIYCIDGHICSLEFSCWSGCREWTWEKAIVVPPIRFCFFFYCRCCYGRLVVRATVKTNQMGYIIVKAQLPGIYGNVNQPENDHWVVYCLVSEQPVGLLHVLLCMKEASNWDNQSRSKWLFIFYRACT